MREIDEDGNDPAEWLLSGNTLLVARDSLCACRETARAKGGPIHGYRKVRYEEVSDWVEIMLAGFGIENLLKALYVAKGGILYKRGHLVRGDTFRNHNLGVLADTARFTISAQERHLLSMMSRIMVGIGRYPRGPHHKDGEPPNEGWSNTNDDRMSELIKRLKGEIRAARLETKKPPA